MTDDLDDLKSLMSAATPRPDDARRAENLRVARKNFDAVQGSRQAARPIPATGPLALWTGVKTMLNTITTKGGLTATTALVACGFLFLTPVGQDMWRAKPQLAGDVGADLAVQTRPNDAIARQEVTPPVIVAKDNPSTAASEQPRLDETLSAPAPAAAPPTANAAAEQDTDISELIARGAISTAEPASPQNAPASTLTQSRTAMADTVAPVEPDTEAYANATDNPLKITAESPVSTFSIDVDTASYSVVRSSLMRGQLPAVDAVRIEEMVNYFPYTYPAPDAGEAPFRPTVTTFQTPWNADTQLVRVAIQGAMPALADRPPLNLVFLIDTSGSMDEPAKLPLLKQSFMLMLDQLRPEDQVAIVAYAGSAGQVLAPTAAADKQVIRAALDSLGAGGSTNGQGGLEQAYAVAAGMAQDGEVSRVILATDGDFNVGIDSPDALKAFIAKKRDTGTYLSVLGFGRGNLDDATMQALAQNGNGQAAYIDTLSEAQKVLVDQLTGALFPIAGDVKIQVEWNPAQIAEYRLIGYETRALNREDFNNDKVDAGELGAGHTVTALYEVTPVGSPAQLSDPLRYQPEAVAETSDELGFLRLRYKRPGEAASQLIETPILGATIPGTDANFAAAIAGFGQLLKGSPYLGDWGYADAIALAAANRGDDSFGYRTEAVQLMRLAQSLSQN
jgi:Ca-activated chloride channel family protein